MFNMTSSLSATIWNRKMTCSTVDRSVFGVMLLTCCENLTLRSGTVLGLLRFNKCFKFPKSQKSYELRSGVLRGRGSGKWRLMIRSSVKRLFRTPITQRILCGGTPSYIKVVFERHWCVCKFGTFLFFNNDAYRCPLIKHVTGSLASDSSKKYGPRMMDAVSIPHTFTFGGCLQRNL